MPESHGASRPEPRSLRSSSLVGLAAAVVAAFSVAGLLAVGAPLLLPFIVMAAAAVGAWAARWRTVAVGLVVGTLAWSAFIVLALLEMGDAMEGFN